MGEQEDLRGRTKQFALRIIRLYGALPKAIEAQIIGKQVLRSGTAVGANYREAFGAGQMQNLLPKWGIALRSWKKQRIGLSCL